MERQKTTAIFNLDYEGMTTVTGISVNKSPPKNIMAHVGASWWLICFYFCKGFRTYIILYVSTILWVDRVRLLWRFPFCQGWDEKFICASLPFGHCGLQALHLPFSQCFLFLNCINKWVILITYVSPDGSFQHPRGFNLERKNWISHRSGSFSCVHLLNMF